MMNLIQPSLFWHNSERIRNTWVTAITTAYSDYIFVNKYSLTNDSKPTGKSSMFSTPWHISRYTIRMSSNFYLNVLHRLISKTFIEKLSWTSNQKIFFRNPPHNLLELLTILLSIFDLGRRDKFTLINIELNYEYLGYF